MLILISIQNNMTKTLNIHNSSKWENEPYFFERLERDLWAWKKCYNCNFCWDVTSEVWIIKDSIVDCLWLQAGIQNVKIDETCQGHEYLENYSILRKGD